MGVPYQLGRQMAARSGGIVKIPQLLRQSCSAVVGHCDGHGVTAALRKRVQGRDP
jgi:hypothetical protein